VEAHTAEVARRAEAAALVRAAVAELRVAGERELTDEGLTADEADRVAQWDHELERLLEEARAGRGGEVEVPLPSSLSATALARLRDEPESLATDLARPMPRKPSPAARFGTRFHAWVEARFGQQQLVGLDEVPGRGDEGIEDDTELQELIERFTAGPFGDRVPHAVEPPFALVLGGQVVRGRIDAVYSTEGGGFLVVDWKTSRRQTADPLQLAIYRLAWAELAGVPVERVEAAFFYVRTGELVQHPGLPGRAELEDIVAG
jgi:DNA helicase-2/ATP-dependent DNA helicase PcrA